MSSPLHNQSPGFCWMFAAVAIGVMITLTPAACTETGEAPAPSPEMQQPLATAGDPDQVQERGVLPATPPNLLAKFQIINFGTSPDEFAPGSAVTGFRFMYHCSENQLRCGTDVQVENVRVEIWHTPDNGQPRLVVGWNNIAVGVRREYGACAVNIDGYGCFNYGGFGSYPVSGGKFTVKLIKGPTTVARDFALVPKRFRVRNSEPAVADHRTNR